MSKTRDNIIFRKEWRDALKGFGAEIRAEVYEAILAYSFDGEVIEMSDVARMAFTFIKTHIDNINSAYEATCEKRRQSAQQRWNNANECKPMQKDANDANAYFALKNDASECKPMHNDNDIDIDNNISLSKSLSSSGEKEFDTEKIGGLTAAEREKILNVFYFERNLITAKEESEKFINYYEANGWCRANSNKPVKNKISLAKSWKVERIENKYLEDLRDWLQTVYLTLCANGQHEEASKLLGIDYRPIENGYALFVKDREQAKAIEMHRIPKRFQNLTYLIPKTN